MRRQPKADDRRQHMSNKESSRQKAAIGEFGLIVLGVLVALLAESWWSEREDREFERQVLVDAISEFRENIEILDADIAKNVSVHDLLVKIDGIPNSALLAMTDEESSELFAVEKQFNAGFDPAMGAIDALVRSGDIRLIRDRELRLSLARWSALLTRAERFESQHGQFQFSGYFRLIPAFNADGKWTILERREIRELLNISRITLKLSLDTMEDLRVTAEIILERLSELTE